MIERWLGGSHGVGASLPRYLSLHLATLGQEQPDPSRLSPRERTHWEAVMQSQALATHTCPTMADFSADSLASAKTPRAGVWEAPQVIVMCGQR